MRQVICSEDAGAAKNVQREENRDFYVKKRYACRRLFRA
jgi:hypothetical protein